MSPPVPTYLGPGWMSLIFNWGVLMCQNRSSCQPFFICTYWWSIIDGCAGVRKLEGCTDHVWWAPCQRDWSQGSQCEDNQVQRFQFEHFDCSSLNILIVQLWAFWLFWTFANILSPLPVSTLGWSTLTSTVMCRESSLSVPSPGGWPQLSFLFIWCLGWFYLCWMFVSAIARWLRCCRPV